MPAIIYTDFTLIKWMRDIRKWYNTQHYPKGYTGAKTLMDAHLRIMRKHYNYDQICGETVEEKRISFFSFCQSRVEIELARMI